MLKGLGKRREKKRQNIHKRIFHKFFITPWNTEPTKRKTKKKKKKGMETKMASARRVVVCLLSLLLLILLIHSQNDHEFPEDGDEIKKQVYTVPYIIFVSLLSFVDNELSVE